MTIPFINPLPISGNDPSIDQPNMTINNNSLNAIWPIDHIGFNASSSTPAGTHAQMQFAANQSFSSLPTNIVNVAYPKAGVANTNSTDLYMINSSATFPLSILRACGYFTTTSSSGAVTTGGINIASNTSNGSGLYTITLGSGVTTGNNVMISVNVQSTTSPPSSFTLSPSYYFQSNVLQIFAGTPTKVVSFFVYQI